jgi:hypothetical protein
MNRFGLDSFFLRFLFAAVVVFATYNAEGFSYFHWIINNLGQLNLYMARAAVVLVLSWIILIRASIASLSLIGFAIVTLAFGLLAWLIITRLGLNASSKGAIIYIIELAIAFVLSLGVPWSQIKRKIMPTAKTEPVVAHNKKSDTTSTETVQPPANEQL